MQLAKGILRYSSNVYVRGNAYQRGFRVGGRNMLNCNRLKVKRKQRVIPDSCERTPNTVLDCVLSPHRLWSQLDDLALVQGPLVAVTVKWCTICTCAETLFQCVKCGCLDESTTRVEHRDTLQTILD